MIKGIISLGVFILLVIVAWWTISSDEKSNELALQEKEHYVVAYMNDFEMTAMDDTGTPGFTLKGSHMEKFNRTNETRIRQPVFQLLQSEKHWKISADSAIVNDDNETIQLNNNVIMQQLAAQTSTNEKNANVKNPVQTGVEITIRTPTLLINTKNQIAETKAEVTITQGNSKISSTGMVFNNLSNEIKLSSNVHGSISND